MTAVILLALLGACSSGSPPAERAERSDRGGSGPARAMPAEDRARLRASGAPSTLADLESVEQLGKLFDDHQDVPRLVLLLSPT